jgi:hypothetical protein
LYGVALPMTRIVSLTPLAVQRDSRSFKQAASVARFGYESVLLEGEPSDVDRDALPFVLRTAKLARVWPWAGWLGLKLRGAAFRMSAAAVDVLVVLWRALPGTAPRLPKAALYYLHSPMHYPAVRFRGRWRRPFIYDAHDFYSGFLGDTPAARLTLWLERRCVREAAEVVTVSDGCADLMEDRFGRRPKVIRNMHDPRMDESVNRGLRATLDLEPDAFLLVMVGNAKPGTAVDQALEAMSRLPVHVHLAFVGGGWDRWRARVEELELARRVHLCPPVSPTAVAPFIASANAGVVLYFPASPSHLHALPNGFFISVAAGLPLLYPAQLPDLRELADKHELGLPIDPLHATSLVSAVSELLGDRTRLTRFRERVKQAGGVLNWEVEERRLKAAIEEALSAA